MDIDTMTPDQLRDALAWAAGFQRTFTDLSKWYKPGITNTDHPIPPLDSPEALGVVAGMMPDNWALEILTGPRCDRTTISVD